MFVVLNFTVMSSKFMIHFEFILCMGEVWIDIHILACRYLIVLAPFVEQTILSPLNCFFTFVGNQLSLFVCVCLRTTFFLIDLFVFIAIPHCFDYCGFIVSLDIR